ncbi:MAG: hypothetical protein PWP31_1888 [Clostridia bacterium]|nr:hypothetical protein [Clostridia bacterium]
MVLYSEELDIYNIILNCDYHSTVSSTTALEAPFLGKPNIFINIDGMSQKYYADILKDPATVRYVNTPEEMVTTIMSWNKIDQAKLLEYGSLFFTSGYSENIKNALRKIGFTL